MLKAFQPALPERTKKTGKAPWLYCKDLFVDFSDDQLVRAWKELPREQRLTLFLIDVEQLSQKKVAEVMGVSLGVVRSRTRWARVMLKKRLLFYCQKDRIYRK